MALKSLPLYLYNSLTRKKELFSPIKKSNVGLYSCGPTVYDFAHIGNFRSFMLSDILVRVLKRNGYHVKYVQNITDVGHLTDDADTGEDKLEKAANEGGETAQEIAKKYTKHFIDDSKKLNFLEPNFRPRATEYVEKQIDFIKELEDKGLTYSIGDGVYFDTSKSPNYGELATIDINTLQDGARIEKNLEKKSKNDFALWKLSPKNQKRHMEWKSPWGVGFPGWHIECSAIGRELLGFPFDIHVGGIDHREIHHTNEIAQNEGITETKSVNYWIHSAFITVDGKKMGKSLGNIYSISDLEERGTLPIAYRYLVLGTHYRQTINFTFESVKGAENSYKNLVSTIKRLRTEKSKFSILSSIRGRAVYAGWKQRFFTAVNDDLNIPLALASLHEMLKDKEATNKVKLRLISEFDEILGLGLSETAGTETIPKDIIAIANKRQAVRVKKDWEQADELRKELLEKGYIIEDKGVSYELLRK